MSYSGISLTNPLISAHSSRLCGGKGSRLALLGTESYRVPKGFVISADAYKLHLWKAGIKAVEIDSTDPQACRQVYDAILREEIPEEVSEAIQDAYKTLALHVGYAAPVVLVRPSIIEPENAVRPEKRLYHHSEPISGSADIANAVKEVWASVWSEDACIRRKVIESDINPAMAVLVQDYIKCRWAGEVRTSDLISGRCDVARVLYYNPKDPANRQTTVFRLDSMDFEEPVADQAVLHVLSAAVDKAIMLEKTLNSGVYMEWGWDGEWMWVFQADPAGPAPAPAPEIPAGLIFQRLTSTPVPAACNFLSTDKAAIRVLSQFGVQEDVTAAGGHLYRVIAADIGLEKVENLVAALPKATEAAVMPLALPSESVVGSDLADMLAKYQQHIRALQQWMLVSSLVSYYLRDRINEFTPVQEDQKLLGYLLGGIDNVFSMRDVRLQDFGDRLMQAQLTHDIDSPGWWKPFKKEVEEFASEYCYSFTSPAQYYDFSLWSSWSEDVEQIFRLVQVISVQQDVPSVAVMHTAAQDAYKQAIEKVQALPDVHEAKILLQFVCQAREWIAVRFGLEHSLARVGSGFRQLMKQAWHAIKQGREQSWLDVFELPIDYIIGLLTEPGDINKASLASALSASKHDRWLKSRTSPASVIGVESPTAVSATGREPLHFRQVLGDQARGRLKLLRDYVDISGLELGDVALVEFPGLAWSPALKICSGIVCENLPEVPPEAYLYTEYRTTTAYGSLGARAALEASKKVSIDAERGMVKPW